MDQPDVVSGLQRAGELRHDRHGDVGGQAALAADHRLEVAAGDVTHRDVAHAVDLAGVVNRHDVRVLEARGQRRLAQEPLADHGVGRQVGGEHLERDVALEAELCRPVDGAGAAPSDRGLEPVTGTEHRVSEPLPPARRRFSHERSVAESL